MATTFSQRDPVWADKQLDASGFTMGRDGCVVSDVIHQVNRFLGTNDTPGYFCDWLNRNAGFTREGLFIWSKLAEYTQGRLRYLGSGWYAKLRKKYTLQQVAFGKINHWIARLPGDLVYDPWHGRKVLIEAGAIEIEGKPRRLLPNFRYLG